MNTLDYQTAHQILRVNPLTGLLYWRKQFAPRCKLDVPAGSLTREGYLNIAYQGTKYQQHRVIWLMCVGSWPNDCIDHINGIKTDNRLENLREFTQRENSQNQYRHRAGKLPGCYFDKSNQRWRAQLQIEGEHKHIGRFDTEQEAHAAYMAALKQFETRGELK